MQIERIMSSFACSDPTGCVYSQIVHLLYHDYMFSCVLESKQQIITCSVQVLLL